MKKIIAILCYFIFINKILIQSQITQNSQPTTLTILSPPTQQYIINYYDSWITCAGDIYFVVSNSNPLDSIVSVTSESGYVETISDQIDNKSYRLNLNSQSFGSNLYIITATSTLGTTIGYTLNFTCLPFDINDIVMKVLGKDTSRIVNSYFSSFIIEGFTGRFQSISASNSAGLISNSQSNSFYVFWSTNTLKNDFNTNWTAEITADMSHSFTITYENPYSDLSVEYVSEVTQYPPPSTEASPEFGSGYTSVVTFVSSSTKSTPFLQFFDPIFGDLIPRPISGVAGSIKYIASFMDYFRDGIQATNSDIVYQNGISTGNVSLRVILKNLVIPPFPIIGITNYYSINAPFFSIEFSVPNLFNAYSILYSDFDITLTQKHSFPFAFGFGNNKNFTYKVAFPKPIQTAYSGKTINFESGSYTVNREQASVILPPNELIDDVSRSIVTSYEFVQIFNTIHLLRLSANDKYGIAYISSKRTTHVNKFAKLTSGTEFNGTFEIIIDLFESFEVKITNNLGVHTLLKQGFLISLNPPVQLILPEYTNIGGINFNSFKNISFIENNLNLNNQSSYNIFYFNSTDIHIQTQMFFALYDPISVADRRILSTSKFFPVVWNSTIQMFNCKFVLPKNNMFGNILYSIQTASQIAYFSPDFETPVPLVVNSTYLDSYGPIFTKIEKLPTDPYTITAVGMKIGWRLTIEDELNGFDRGYIKVMGSVDSSSYHFNFTIADVLQGGDRWYGQYEITFIMPSTSCYPQDYVMTQVYLYDTNDILSEFNVFSDYPNPTANPFIYFMDDVKINSISISCSTIFDDPTPPILKSFVANELTPGIIDVGSLDRSIKFIFEATDEESGVREDQLPIVYIQTITLEVIEGKSSILSKEDKTIKYECTIELPVAFGYPGVVSFSVFGLINNGGHYSGFTSMDLKALGFQYYSSVSYSFGQPLIIKTEPITSEGGQLIVYGKGLNNIGHLSVSYSDEGDKLFNHFLSASVVTASYVIVDGIKATTKPYTIKVASSFQDSNEYIVYPIFSNINYPPLPTPSNSPTQLPTNAPQKCFGKPLCGGDNQGYCNEAIGCICKSPWIGASCSSQVIIVPQPNINNTDPTTEIPIIPGTSTSSGNNGNSNIFFKSLISLVSLRELNFNQQEQVKSFTFDKWIFNKINENKNEYTANITTSPLPNGSGESITTNITVVLEWFKNETIIEFASTNLTMNPSSIKYTITITEYAFSSNLNSLQLVMSALFEADTNDVCSVKEFGSTSSGDNSNYVKIQIEDHSLYGRFIKRAIVDSKTTTITNTLLDSSMTVISSSSQSQSLIGITIPNFDTSVIIDPDFSVLLDSNSISSNDENSICQSQSSGLSTAQLAGIIVGSIAFVAVASIATVYYIVQKKKQQKFLGNINNKLKNMN